MQVGAEDFAGALDSAERSLKVYDAQGEELGSRLLAPMLVRSEAQSGLGRHEDAITSGEAAVSLAEREGTAGELALARWSLAQTLRAAGPEHRARARELAGKARATLVDEKIAPDVVSRIDTFLADVER